MQPLTVCFFLYISLSIFSYQFFLWFLESFNWKVQPSNPTIVTEGEDKSLTWNYTLTADEQTKSQTFYIIRWKKFTSSSSDYVLIGSKTFLSAVGTPSYSEPSAPHIEIDKNYPATLLINKVRREDQGTYKIEYSVQFDGAVLADHEVNVTVLGKVQIKQMSSHKAWRIFFC